MIPFLRTMDPFALEGPRGSPSPFLLIEDSHLFDQSPGQPMKVIRNTWKNGDYTRSQRSRLEVYTGGDPLVIYTGDVGKIGIEAWASLSQACIFDSEQHPEQLPYIYWNILRDLSISKMLHISNQAFYLRKYAQRVADLWEKEYRRRPAIHAKTAVSL